MSVKYKGSWPALRVTLMTTFHKLAHLKLTTATELDTIIVPFYGKKLKDSEGKQLTGSHTDSQ